MGLWASLKKADAGWATSHSQNETLLSKKTTKPRRRHLVQSRNSVSCNRRSQIRLDRHSRRNVSRMSRRQFRDGGIVSRLSSTLPFNDSGGCVLEESCGQDQMSRFKLYLYLRLLIHTAILVLLVSKTISAGGYSPSNTSWEWQALVSTPVIV